jgi:hypothetical protein
MTKYTGIIIVLFLLTSCIKELDGLSNTPEELVLQCYISPSDTVINAVLSRATSFTVTEIPYKDLFIKDAQVTISNGNVDKQLEFNREKNFYQLKITDEFKIEKGKTYSIKAVAKDGKVLTSSCTVPLRSIKPEEIEIEKSFRGSDFVDIRLKWPTSKDDLYILRPYFYYSNIQSTQEPVSHTVQFLTGADVNSGFVTSNYFTNNLARYKHSNVAFIYLADENFYAYSKSLQLNDNNQTDPFAQPVNASYNINGGFGCFGAYNVTRVDLEY